MNRQAVKRFTKWNLVSEVWSAWSVNWHSQRKRDFLGIITKMIKTNLPLLLFWKKSFVDFFYFKQSNPYYLQKGNTLFWLASIVLWSLLSWGYLQVGQMASGHMLVNKLSYICVTLFSLYVQIHPLKSLFLFLSVFGSYPVFLSMWWGLIKSGHLPSPQGIPPNKLSLYSLL